MVQTVTVRFVRGRIRARCNDSLSDLLSILHYDAQRPPGTFLTTQQRTDMQAVVTDLRTILQSTKPR